MAPSPVDRVDVGTIVGGTYEVTRHLGHGGMSEVWAAHHVRLPAREVAIKLLLDIRPSDEAVARFRHEAEIISRLGHPNIVQVFDFNELPGGTPYMVLELLSGETLRAALQRGRMSVDAALAIARQIGSALDAAHRAGIVHRDLKPENIFLCPAAAGDIAGDQVKVLDFGISKVRGSDTVRTLPDSFIGTPRYMSPEQAQGHSDLVDQRSDIFALGAVLYEMLTGQPAFPGRDVHEVLSRVVRDAPRALAGLAPSVPLAVVRAVERALEKDPQKRFSTAAEFISAVNAECEPSARDSRGSGFGRLPGASGVSEQLPSLAASAFVSAGRVSWRRVALVAGVVVAAGLGFWAARSDGPLVNRVAQLTAPSPGGAAANKIAVMEFENQRSDDPKNDWYCKALQTAFNTELSKIPQVSVLAEEIIEQTAQEVGLDRMAAARRLGVRRFVTGSFAVVGDSIRIDARVVETAQGVQEVAEKVEGRFERFFELQRDLTLAMLRSFNVQLNEAQTESLNRPTNAQVDKYRMLLEAEGVTGGDGKADAAPSGPQSSVPGDARVLGAWIAGVALAGEPPGAATDAVREVLEEYRRAHETGDLDRLAALYVMFPESQRRAVTAYAKNVRDLRVELKDVAIQPRQHDVVVAYTRTDHFVDKETGEPMTLEVRLTRFLVQTSGQWKFAAEN